MTQKVRNLILKATLMRRRLCGPDLRQTKEDEIAEYLELYKDDAVDGVPMDEYLADWIDSLREDLAMTPEEREARREAELEEMLEHEGEWEQQWSGMNEWYCPSCTAGDYSPGNPWDAPGMSIRDFI